MVWDLGGTWLLALEHHETICQQRDAGIKQMKITAEMDTRGFESALSDVATNQLPFATSLALNRVGQKAKLAISSAMKSDFDRPTPYTLNSPMLIPSTKRNLVCEVKLKDLASKLPPSKYLAPEVVAGVRTAKSTELQLRSRGWLPGGMFYVPGAGAKLDQYGNMSAGLLTQVMSALKAQRQDTYFAKRAARRSVKATNSDSTIFVGKPAGGRFPLGVYQRTSAGGLKPLMIFVQQAHYQARLPFYSVIQNVYEVSFQDEFANAMQSAIATASRG
jgi:hypothetical protein